MNTPEQPFQRGVVRPIQCLREGYQLIKKDYWLFLGICVVGVLIGSAAPMSILMGPMMCGMYLCLLLRIHGREVRFNDLFEGFSYFVPSLIATLLMMVPALLLLIPFYIGFFVAMFSFLPTGPGAPPPTTSDLLSFFGVLFPLVFAVVLAAIFTGALFTFTFPLIVDRKMSGLAAVRTSMAAVFGNLGGVLGLTVLHAFLSFAGALLCCYVGAFFEMPILMASLAVAYRRVFPSDTPPERPSAARTEPDWPDEPDRPERPDRPAGPAEEGIQKGPSGDFQDRPLR